VTVFENLVVLGAVGFVPCEIDFAAGGYGLRLAFDLGLGNDHALPVVNFGLNSGQLRKCAGKSRISVSQLRFE